MTPTTTWYLVLSALLFTIGTVGVLVRRNPLVMFMCIELMLNAVNLSFVALSKRLLDIDGQSIVLFVLVVAAAEVVVGLGIVVAIMRNRTTFTADDLAELAERHAISMAQLRRAVLALVDDDDQDGSAMAPRVASPQLRP